ncbi:MAG: flagella associated protein [Pseudomonadota bacterium]|jgi:flagellin
MTSILTNNAASAALQTLRNVNRELEMTQNRISTGLKVSSASDNASYWSIATTMRSDSAMMSTVSDALGLGAAVTDTAYQGMNSAIDLVSQIKTKLLAARNPGVDKDKVNTEISALKAQLLSGVKASSFNGQNWLYNTAGTPGTKEIVGSFSRDAAGDLTIGFVSVDTASTVLVDTNTAGNGILTKGVGAAGYTLSGAASDVKVASTTTETEITAMINAVDDMLNSMTNAASVLGATSTTISKQAEFVKTLKASIDRGIGSLVDADMNEESSKLKALQTQQQLGIQALTIANSDSSNILALFR